MSVENPLEIPSSVQSSDIPQLPTPGRISHGGFFALLSKASEDEQAINKDAIKNLKPQGFFTPEEARDALAKLLSPEETAPLNNVPERSLISPITTEGPLVETESGRERKKTRIPTPKSSIGNFANNLVRSLANTTTNISVSWLELRKERASRRWGQTIALIIDREERFEKVKDLFEGDFRRVTPSKNLPQAGTAEYDRELLLFARRRIAEVAVIDSMGKAAENVGEHFAHLREEKGIAQVDRQELPSLVEEIKEVLPKRIELNSLKAKEVIGTKLALVRGAIEATVGEVSETVVAFFKSGVVLSSFGGSLVGSGIALARGIVEVKTIGIHAGLGAGFAFVSYILCRKFTDSSSGKKVKKGELEGQETGNVQILPE